MMTTNLFVIANENNCEPTVVLEFYCLYFQYVGVLASKVQQFLTVYTIGLSLARFWRAFGIFFLGEGRFEPPQTPPRYATAYRSSDVISTLTLNDGIFLRCDAV